MRGWARQGVRIAAVAAAALALAGCFDLELTLKLNGDGSGRLSTRAILAKEWVNLGAHAKPPESKLLGAGRHVHRKSEIRNGQLVQEESTNFDNLSQLKGIEGGAIEVKSLGRTFWGAERTRVRWVLHTSKRPSEAPAPDPRILDSVLGGHTLTMTMELPCTVTRAEEVKLNFAQVAPSVSRDLLQGSTVRWVVPLSARCSRRRTARSRSKWSASASPGSSRAARRVRRHRRFPPCPVSMLRLPSTRTAPISLGRSGDCSWRAGQGRRWEAP